MRYFFTSLCTCFFVLSSAIVFAQEIDDAYVQNILLSQDKRAIQKLLDDGLDVNSRDANGDTLLFYVLTRQLDFDTAQMLIDAGADVNLPSNNGLTLLVFTTSILREFQIKNKDFPKLNNEMQQAKIAEQEKFLVSHTAKLLNFLLKNGADVNQDTPQGTALMNASTNDLNIKLVKTLLASGAKVNQKDRLGRTALFYAEAFGSNSISTELLKSGADISIKDDNGQTYLDVSKFDILDSYEN